MCLGYGLVRRLGRLCGAVGFGLRRRQAGHRGAYANGEARRAALGERYDEVQAEVNRLLSGGKSGAQARSASNIYSYDVDALTRAVIRGDYGNGAERKRRLGGRYAAVRKRVNEMLS